jgi:thiol:disulfide interchange protein
MPRILALILALFCALWTPNLRAAGFDDLLEPAANEEMQFKLTPEFLSAPQGGKVRVLVEITPPKGWWWYWLNSGCVSMPATPAWQGEGAKIGGNLFSVPHFHTYKIGDETIRSFSYPSTGALVTDVEITAASGHAALKFSGQFQFCDLKGCNMAMPKEKIEIAVGPQKVNPAFSAALAKFSFPSTGKISLAAKDGQRLLSFAGAADLKAEQIILAEAVASVDQTIPELKWTFKDGLWSAPLPKEIKLPLSGLILTGHEGLILDKLDLIKAAVAPVLEKKNNLSLESGEKGSELKGGKTDSEAANSGSKPVASAIVAEVEKASAAKPQAADEQLSLWKMLAYLFIGGIILNLMPCVFPVLSLKLMSLVKLSQQSRRESLMQALAYSAGLLVSMWVLVGVLVSLIAAGKEAGWAFQSQNPYFSCATVLILFMLSINLFGVFELGNSLTSVGGSVQRQGLMGAFFSGVFATLVATPCSGPFLGAATAQILDQPTVWIFFGFTCMGLGLALPFILTAVIPGFARILPRPGAWMEYFKKSMGFVMLAACVFFFKPVIEMTDIETGLCILGLMISLGFALWIYGTWALPHLDPGPRWTAIVVAAVIGLGSIGGSMKLVKDSRDEKRKVFLATQEEAKKNTDDVKTAPVRGQVWEPYKRATLQAYVSQGRPVFVDFTASWCLICQVNKKSSMMKEEVRAVALKKGVVYMEADATDKEFMDPEVAAGLKEFKRKSVPLYLWYDGKSEAPIIWPQTLSPGLMKDAFNQLPDAK